MNLFDLTGKTAVVIGGNSTLGAEMALGLAGHGAKVAIVGRNPDTAQAVSARINDEAGAEASRSFQADAVSQDDLRRVLAEITQWSGSIDILLNCPGRHSATPFFDIAEEEWDGIMDVNLKSVVLACQIFGKLMVEAGKGSIINISSVSSLNPLSKVFTYSVSKAGVNSVTKFLAREFAPSGVRVNAIIPGFFPAVQNRSILSEERIASIMNHTPMRRFGEARELQGAVVYLASEQASGFTTGSILQVDGGFTSMTI
jgi:NAD(P)-dependent dehydrogenase (short-subunit alcohol dehydrogenase family)